MRVKVALQSVMAVTLHQYLMVIFSNQTHMVSKANYSTQYCLVVLLQMLTFSLTSQ